MDAVVYIRFNVFFFKNFHGFGHNYQIMNDSKFCYSTWLYAVASRMDFIYVLFYLLFFIHFIWLHMKYLCQFVC